MLLNVVIESLNNLFNALFDCRINLGFDPLLNLFISRGVGHVLPSSFGFLILLVR